MQTIDVALPRADVRWGAALGLLQAGFSMRTQSGMSARVFMREVLGFPDAYIEGVVSTVFVDDSPVDDIDAARLVEGTRIALSAAMPGLVGAVMRRNSPYAALRESISYQKDCYAVGETKGGGSKAEARDPTDGEAGGGAGRSPEIRVGVKLFNSVMTDRGPEVLARGIYLRGEAAVEALRSFDVEAATTLAVASNAEAAPSSEIFLRIVEAQL